MKKLKSYIFCLILVCIFYLQPTFAQKAHFYLQIKQNEGIPKNIIVRDYKAQRELLLNFSNPSIDSLFSNYIFYHFEKAFPTAKSPFLQTIYEVIANDLSLMVNATNKFNNIFPYGKEISEPILLGYTPNDYGVNGTLKTTDGALDLINAEKAWEITKGDNKIIIGITDTYFDINHEDLQTQIINVRGSNSNVNSTHGTEVAGCVAAATDNGVGKSGIGFNCKLIVSSTWHNDNEMLILSQLGARVLNASWINNCSFDPVGQAVYDEIYENGTIVIAAAGNGNQAGGSASCGSGVTTIGSGLNRRTYPASYNHVISVSSVNLGDNYQQGDIFHTYNDAVDITSPGFHVQALLPNNNYIGAGRATDCQLCDANTTCTDCMTGYCTECAGAWGTSFASPIVAGVCGLILSANPCLSPDNVEDILKESSNKDVHAKNPSAFIGFTGAGRVDAYEAVKLASEYPQAAVIEKGRSITWTIPKTLTCDLVIRGNSTLTIASNVVIAEGVSVTVESGNLIIQDNAEISLLNNSILAVHRNGVFTIEDGGMINISDGGFAEIQGLLNYENTDPLKGVTLTNENSQLYLNQCTVTTPDNVNFTFTGKGQLRINSYWQLPNPSTPPSSPSPLQIHPIFNLGTNSKINISGYYPGQKTHKAIVIENALALLNDEMVLKDLTMEINGTFFSENATLDYTNVWLNTTSDAVIVSGSLSLKFNNSRSDTITWVIKEDKPGNSIELTKSFFNKSNLTFNEIVNDTVTSNKSDYKGTNVKLNTVNHFLIKGGAVFDTSNFLLSKSVLDIRNCAKFYNNITALSGAIGSTLSVIKLGVEGCAKIYDNKLAFGGNDLYFEMNPALNYANNNQNIMPNVIYNNEMIFNVCYNTDPRTTGNCFLPVTNSPIVFNKIDAQYNYWGPTKNHPNSNNTRFTYSSKYTNSCNSPLTNFLNSNNKQKSDNLCCPSVEPPDPRCTRITKSSSIIAHGVVIKNFEKWDGSEKLINGVIRIPRSATLEIHNSEIFMRQCAQIVVEGNLILFNTRFSACENSSWKGIKIINGGVMEMNASMISEAEIGILVGEHNAPLNKPFLSGTLKMNGGNTMLNNIVHIQVEGDGTIKNNVMIKETFFGEIRLAGASDCIQNLIPKPIIIKNTDGFVIENNQFYSTKTSLTINESKNFMIKNNTFVNAETAIKTEMNQINDKGASISHNYFWDNQKAIVFINSDHRGLAISCNGFYNYSEYAIYSENTFMENIGNQNTGAGNMYISNSTLPNHYFAHKGNAMNYFHDPSMPINLTTGNGYTANAVAAQQDNTCGASATSAKATNINNNVNAVEETDEAAILTIYTDENFDQYQLNIYPNPFNRQTNIIYTLIEPQEVTLFITNIHGQVIDKLIDKTKQEAGCYKLTYDATHLAPGIYYYTLKAGGVYIETKKMGVLR